MPSVNNKDERRGLSLSLVRFLNFDGEGAALALSENRSREWMESDIPAAFARVSFLCDEMEFEEAEEALESAGSHFSKELLESKALFWHLKGRLKNAEDENEAAEACFLKALETDPAFFPSELELARVYHDQDKSEECLGLMRALVKKLKRREEVLCRCGELLYSYGRYQEAWYFFKKALWKNFFYTANSPFLYETLCELRNFSVARLILKVAAHFLPRKDAFLQQEGLLYASCENFSRAYVCFQRLKARDVEVPYFLWLYVFEILVSKDRLEECFPLALELKDKLEQIKEKDQDSVIIHAYTLIQGLCYRVAVQGDEEMQKKQREMLLQLKKEMPDDEVLSFLSAAYLGETPDHIPRSFMEKYYDIFSSSFDEVLTKLDYSGPKLLEKAVKTVPELLEGGLSILDAGCGTGFCGVVLRPYAKPGMLKGVDMSSDMVSYASAKGAYDKIEISDLESFLEQYKERERYDLVSCMDVTIYFGDLSRLIAGFSNVLLPGGYLIASFFRTAEKTDKGYRLNFSGRFSHSGDYLLDLFKKNKLEIIHMDEHFFRKEFHDRENALIVVARKATEGAFMTNLVQTLNQHNDKKEFQATIDAVAVLSDRQKTSSVWICLGNAYEGLDDYENAISCHEKALKKEKTALAYGNMAGFYYSLNDYDKASEMCDKALEIDSEYVPAIINKANILHETGQYEKALSLYKKAFDINDSENLALLNQTNPLFELERYEEAGKVLEEFKERFSATPAYYASLATLYEKTGEYEKSAEAYLKALEGNSDDKHLPNAFSSLLYGMRTYFDTDEKEIEKFLKAWKKIQPDSPVMRHASAALGFEKMPDRASEQYVSILFDSFASSFDKTLKKLKYNAPEMVAKALKRIWPSSLPKTGNILDLGCGTGLCGYYVKEVFKKASLTGVDLSEMMLKKAAERGIYKNLVRKDILAFLKDPKDVYVSAISSDVLTYLGDLAPVFTGVSKCLVEKGVFIFTVTANAGDPETYALEPSGRYMHGRKYLESALKNAGFDGIEIKEETLREEHGVPVKGFLVSAFKP